MGNNRQNEKSSAASCGESYIKSIIMVKKDYFSMKKWHGIYKSGERMGRD